MPRVLIDNQRPPRRRRWLIMAGAAVLTLALTIIYGVPWWLGSGPGRRWLLDRAAQALRPARLEVQSLSWSWFGPTRMQGFVLRDREGDAVVSAPEAIWDRNLWQALFDKPRYGTLRLPGARLDIERSADGSIDLAETLRPILIPHPRTQFVIRVDGGSVRMRAPELETPLLGRELSLVIDRPVDPAPLTWQLRFNEENPAPGKARAGRFECEGRLDKSVADSEQRGIDIAVRTFAWPLNVNTMKGVTAEGTLDLATDVKRTAGSWRTDGKATVSALELQGSALRGDRPRFERLEGSWKLQVDQGIWKIDALNIQGPGLKLAADATLPASGPSGSRITGELDLPQLAAQFPKTLGLHEDLRLERGKANVDVTSRPVPDTSSATEWRIDARVSDLRAHRGNTALTLKAPAQLGADLRSEPDRWVVERFDLETAFLKAEGSGDVDHGINLTGTIDLAALAEEAGTLVDLNDWKPSGSGKFEGHYERRGDAYNGRLTLDLDGLKLESAANNNSARLAASLPSKARMVAEVSGGADSAGWPTSWRHAEAKVESESVNATIAGSEAAGGLSQIDVEALPEISVGDARWRGRVRIAGRRKGDSWDVPEARLELAPAAGDASLIFALHGRYDASSDTLTLISSATPDASGVLTLGPRGIVVKDARGRHWSLEADGALDMKQLDQVIAAGRTAAPFGIEGRVELSTTVRELDDGVALRLDAKSTDALLGLANEPVPMALTVDAMHSFADNRTSVNEFKFSSEYGLIEAAGSLTDPSGARVADIRGHAEPNWQRMAALLAERVEPSARVAGHGRDFRVKGSLFSDDPAAVPLEGDIGVDLDGLDVYGMKFGPAPLVVRWTKGEPSIDPIDTSLNGGRVHLKPVLVRGAEEAPWALGLASGSGIDNAAVNDEVSHRVLAFVAPVLDRATRVNGAVSARFEEVSIPLARGAANDAVVEGTIIFHDVTFEPGPMAMRLYDALGMQPMSLRLDQPVLLAISDGVVHQRGFSLPLGNVAHVLMDGEVGFDRSVALDVRVPLSGQRFATVPVFSRIAPAMRLEFPIRGTLDDPKIDTRAMGDAMKRVGLDVAQAAGFGGIEALVRQMATPRDPEEEARLKAEREERQRVRREKQQQKREEQRLKREERKAARRAG